MIVVFFIFVSIVVRNKGTAYLKVTVDDEILVKRDVKNIQIGNSISLRNRNEGLEIIKDLPY